MRRTAAPIPTDCRYVDIADREPAASPQDIATRYSVYTDTQGFMEIEAAGGCPAVLVPGGELRLEVQTVYERRG